MDIRILHALEMLPRNIDELEMFTLHKSKTIKNMIKEALTETCKCDGASCFSCANPCDQYLDRIR